MTRKLLGSIWKQQVRLPKYNGKVIIYEVNAKTLEDTQNRSFAVAEFPSLAERFYNSPEHIAARKFRIASTEGSVLQTNSVPSQN